MLFVRGRFTCTRPPELMNFSRVSLLNALLIFLVTFPTTSPHRTTRLIRDTTPQDPKKTSPREVREASPSYTKRFAGSTNDKSKTTPLSSRIVRTKYGDVSGVIVTHESRHIEPVEVFRGVPYAMPPVGNLRFMPPVTGAQWSGVKVADKFSPVCPQRLPDISNETEALKSMPKGRLESIRRLLPYLQIQSEDCLYLNIYVPAQGMML